MKVDPNAPANPFMEMSINEHPYVMVHYGIPIRLAIAAQIMAGLAADHTYDPPSAKDAAEKALKSADALIAANNRGQS